MLLLRKIYRPFALGLIVVITNTVKGEVLPYSLPNVGPGADPGVQAVNPQVTISHLPGGRLPLLSARPAFYLHKRSLDGATPY